MGRERYGVNWPGKADCFKTIQTPSVATLRHCPEESYPKAPFFSRGDAEAQSRERKGSANSAPPREPFRYYSVAGGAFIICLEPELTLDLIRDIAALKPERVVCLDEGFADNDQLKANAVQTFKTKGVTSFNTV